MLKESHLVTGEIHEFDIYLFVVDFRNLYLHFVGLGGVSLDFASEAEFHLVLGCVDLGFIALKLEVFFQSSFDDVRAPGGDE
jgi:hypothetical protein